ncbi:MAG TPA: hypothetical protein VKX17_26750 [Planctomycetota bacterium]|nr:hypothetical protein [Planctomycetota bacterium]
MSRFTFEVIEEDQKVIDFRAARREIWVEIISEIERADNCIVLRNLHIDGAGAGTLGLKGIRDLMRDFCAAFGVKSLHVYGARRTTGANPGSIPAPIYCEVRDNGQTRFGRLEAGAQ